MSCMVGELHFTLFPLISPGSLPSDAHSKRESEMTLLKSFDLEWQFGPCTGIVILIAIDHNNITIILCSGMFY